MWECYRNTLLSEYIIISLCSHILYDPHDYLHDVHRTLSDLFPCSISTLQTGLLLRAYGQIRVAHLPTQVHGQGLVQYQTANCDTQLYASHSLGHNLVLILDVLLVILFQVKLGLSALCSTSYWCASCLLLNMPPWKHSKWVRTLLDMSLKQFEKGEEKISHSKNHQPDTPREY